MLAAFRGGMDGFSVSTGDSVTAGFGWGILATVATGCKESQPSHYHLLCAKQETLQCNE